MSKIKWIEPHGVYVKILKVTVQKVKEKSEYLEYISKVF